MKNFINYLIEEEKYKVVGINCHFCKNMRKLPSFYDCKIDANMANSDNCIRYEENRIPKPQLVKSAIDNILDDFRARRISTGSAQDLILKIYKKIY